MGALESLDLEEALRIAVESHMSDIHLALPVRVLKDSDGKTVSIRPTIKATQTMPDGTTKQIDYPDLEAIVQFSGGGGTTFTHPVKGEDEGIAIFSSRSFANWREMGGTQPQVDGRQNDLSDAMFVPGIRSKPRDLGTINTESAQMRSDDGKHVFDLHPKNGPSMAADGGKHVVSVSPSGGISIKTATALAVDAAKGTTFKGAAHFTDAVSSDKSFKAPTLTGQVGGGFTGIANGFVGALIGAGAVLIAMTAQAPSDGRQRASYVLAKVIR